MAVGVAVANAILLVTFAEEYRCAGNAAGASGIQGAKTRLRPILMTTTAIIAGLIPTSLGLGIGGTGRAAIAVTIIGGQSLCLFLTLLLVPVAYVKLDGLEQAALSRRWKDLIGRLKAAIGLRPAPAD